MIVAAVSGPDTDDDLRLSYGDRRRKGDDRDQAEEQDFETCHGFSGVLE